MRNKIEKLNLAMPKIFESMSNVMMDIKAVGKNGYNKMQGFNFRGIDDMYNACNLAMAKNKVFTTSKILDVDRFERKTAKGGTLFCIASKIEFTFHAVDGSKISTEVLSESMDSGDKAAPKVMSIAHKYALIQAFMIPTDDMVDADKDSYIAESKPRITEEQSTSINDRVESYGVNKSGLMSWLNKEMKVKSIDAIPSDCFGFVDAKIESFNPENKKAA